MVGVTDNVASPAAFENGQNLVVILHRRVCKGYKHKHTAQSLTFAQGQSKAGKLGSPTAYVLTVQPWMRLAIISAIA
eukprot:COSAG01_NODE_4762_length_4758_cov_2.512127_2_plen_77_part_00